PPRPSWSRPSPRSATPRSGCATAAPGWPGARTWRSVGSSGGSCTAVRSRSGPRRASGEAVTEAYFRASLPAARSPSWPWWRLPGRSAEGAITCGEMSSPSREPPDAPEERQTERRLAAAAATQEPSLGGALEFASHLVRAEELMREGKLRPAAEEAEQAVK